ncbi:hypothetical protein [Streptomyces poriticola]|uniref:hypothetical protein n=1 Tax=Streptomyces poriticola TaxID=3120506 RepID=UPI002FCE32A5
MSWTRRPLTALAVCVLLLTGSAGCGSGGSGPPSAGASASPPGGRLLDGTDEEGRRLREADGRRAPEVGIEVQPETGASWDVRLTVRNFRFSPSGTAPRPVAGRGVAYLFVDGDLVARLRGPEYRLAAHRVPRGTHHVTARLHADDGTVWAVGGKPVQSTADITASRPTGAGGAAAPTGAAPAAVSAAGAPVRTGGHSSPDRGGKAG